MLIKHCFNGLSKKGTKNVPISGPVLQQKAEEFSKILAHNNETSSCSKRWIDRFKKRYHISSSKIHGEGEKFDVDDEIPLAQSILNHKDSEAVDEEDILSLHDCAITNVLMKGPLNADICTQ
ncbi:hypothetical protein Trydic_g13798 [Trypoxylus dichotomus]